ncbi:MAG: hypothetical protein E7161_04640 [Firmicutes bacterium]|nr:hypothetical protein [Bacillota bacterium]
MKKLPLQFENGTHLRIREERFAQTCEELEEFLDGQKHLHTKAFARDVMFSHELKANNQIEGYTDDVTIVREFIENWRQRHYQQLGKRVLNLYHGYNYILKEKNINPDTVRQLYGILSKDLLESRDIQRMGEYYRTDKVYILINGKLNGEYDHGVDANRIEEFMTAYFEFLNSLDYTSNITEEYIKSQILHFYFVYIHPYFDVNGRTSRTLAMWHLLNTKAYPYIIFNRGITFNGSTYDKVIMDVKKYHDISYFIEYMLKTVQTELEKEYIMQSINNASGVQLTSEDWQTLLYILSMNGLLSVSDFTSMYNRHHDKKRAKFIYETMIDPLIQKGILNVTRTTNHYMFDEYSNEIFEINPSLLDYDRARIRNLKNYK